NDGASDANAGLLREREPRHALRAVLRIESVQRAEVFRDELAVLGAIDAQVMRCDVRIVDHDVVVEAAPDMRLVRAHANARSHVAVAREDLDPHHLGVPSMASRKRRPSATAFACETPCIESVASSASRSRSWVSATTVTL